MNGLPTPPTDNLYKFLAISGLVLLICAGFGLFLEVQRWEKLKYEDMRREYLTNASEKTLMENQLLDLEGKQILRSNVALQGLASVGMLLGMLVAVAGFVLWYWKAQQYQDQIVVLEFEKARLELEKQKQALATLSP